jgi:hypothetical protein
MNHTAHAPSLAAADPAPAPVPPAGHGWTTRKAMAFIGALADLGMVSRAARGVGMSRQSAYALRARLGEGSLFARAWDDALRNGIVRRRARRPFTASRVTLLPPEDDIFGLGR